MKTPRKRLVFATPKRRLKASDLLSNKKKNDLIDNIFSQEKPDENRKQTINSQNQQLHESASKKTEEKDTVSEKRDVQEKPKRSRGRPRKMPIVPKTETQNITDSKVNELDVASFKLSDQISLNKNKHQATSINKLKKSDDKIDQIFKPQKSADAIQSRKGASQDFFDLQNTYSMPVIEPKYEIGEIDVVSKSKPLKSLSKYAKGISYAQKDIILEISSDSNYSTNISDDNLEDYSHNVTKDLEKRSHHKTNKYLEHIAITREKERQMIKNLFSSNQVTDLIQKFLGLNITKTENKYHFRWNIVDRGVERSVEFLLIEGDNDFTYRLESYENVDMPDTFTCMFTFDLDMLVRFMFNMYEILLTKTE